MLTKKAAELRVQPLQTGLQVVHAIPGRVRLRTNDSSLNCRLETIAQQLRQQNGVTEVCTSQQTGSLVVTFDQNKLSLPQMLGLLQQVGVLEPQASDSSEKKTDPFATWKSVDFWKEQGLELIPLITGLVVTGRLGIHGLSAIPVYMFTAGATRQVIQYLEAQPSVGHTDENSEDMGLELNGKTAAVGETSKLPADSSKIPYTVVHAIPGRIRFNVPRIAQDLAYARRLQKLLKEDTQVTSVRVNDAAASIVISYKSGGIPVSYWVGLIEKACEVITQTHLTTATTQQQIPEQVSQPSVPIDSTTATAEQTLEVANVWAELKPPALAASLEFMTKLPV